MSRKEEIIALLQNGGMTHSALAEVICGDANKMPAIYFALKGLVESGVVSRSEGRPAIYSLAGNAEVQALSTASPSRAKPVKRKKVLRDISGDVINNDTLDEAAEAVAASENYGPENELLRRCLERFPDNTDADIVAMKIGLIDVTNSTHLSQHKSSINIAELSEIIANIPDIDAKLAAGDYSVVDEIARTNGNITLLSFASKYCCYHNRYVYHGDSYSIIDNVLKEYLPLYFRNSGVPIERDTFKSYRKYAKYIEDNLDALGIDTAERRKKLDNFIWYKNR